MATLFPFTPNPVSPYSFQPVLDGATCKGTVLWNLQGQRWYLSMVDASGDQLFYVPMVGSPDGVPTLGLTWNGARQVVVVTAQHGRRVGQTLVLTLTGVTPSAYNGVWLMFAESPEMLTYQQTTDPGSDATVQGVLSYNINLAAGYTQTSTVVYRQSTRNIEVDVGVLNVGASVLAGIGASTGGSGILPGGSGIPLTDSMGRLITDQAGRILTN